MRRLTMMLVLGASLAVAAIQPPDDVRVASGRPRLVHVVRPGDTLWSIATRLNPSQDPRSLVHQLVETNGLKGGVIRAGQALYLQDR